MAMALLALVGALLLAGNAQGEDVVLEVCNVGVSASFPVTLGKCVVMDNGKGVKCIRDSNGAVDCDFYQDNSGSCSGGYAMVHDLSCDKCGELFYKLKCSGKSPTTPTTPKTPTTPTTPKTPTTPTTPSSSEGSVVVEACDAEGATPEMPFGKCVIINGDGAKCTRNSAGTVDCKFYKAGSCNGDYNPAYGLTCDCKSTDIGKLKLRCSSDGISTAVIVAIVIGVVICVGVALAAGVVYMSRSRARKQQQAMALNEQISYQPGKF